MKFVYALIVFVGTAAGFATLSLNPIAVEAKEPSANQVQLKESQPLIDIAIAPYKR